MEADNRIPFRLQVGCGLTHTLVCVDDGQVLAFGGGKYGQLGTERIVDQEEPVRLNDGFDNDGKDSLRNKRVIQVSCGAYHSAALTSTGAVYTWGLDDGGRLGLEDMWEQEGKDTEAAGRARNPEAPCLVRAFLNEAIFPGGVSIKQVSCGADHTLCVDEDGRVYAFGSGRNGQLGLSGTADVGVPHRVEGALAGEYVKQVSAGTKHSLAVTARGAVFAWGDGGGHKLGTGDTRTRLVPTLVERLVGAYITQVAASEAHSAAVANDGAVFTWGSGSFGRLGHGGEEDVAAPQAVDALMQHVVVMVACGAFHTMFLTKLGALFTCGGGQYGKLGHGDSLNRMIPVQVAALRDHHVAQIHCSAFHSVVATEQGKVFAWGFGARGRLGLGALESCPVPTLVSKIAAVGLVTGVSAGAGGENAESRRRRLELKARSPAAIACGAQHSLAITNGGEVWAWGEGEFGQLGTGNTADEHRPYLVRGPLATSRVVRVVCGARHSMAITFQGELYAWGRGLEGQLGTGRCKNETLPTLVQTLSGKKVLDVAGGETHSAAVLEDGRLYTWGASDFGKLGHGRAREAQLLPRVVVALEGHRVVQVSLGMSHSACVTDGGHVYTWGGGWLGRLGLGSTANHSTPQRVEALRERKCVQASCGAFHTMAVTDDGDVYVWGRGDERLGIGETRDLLDPLLLPLVRQDKLHVVRVAAAEEHSLLMTADGAVLACGKGRLGKLGQGHTSDASLPLPVQADAGGALQLGALDATDVLKGEVDARSVAAFSNHCMALDRWGRIFVWGCGGSGRLGRGDTVSLEVATPLNDQHLLPMEAAKSVAATAAPGAGGGSSAVAMAALLKNEMAPPGNVRCPELEGAEVVSDPASAEAAAAGAAAAGAAGEEEGKAATIEDVQRLLQMESPHSRAEEIAAGVERLLLSRSASLELLRQAKELEREVLTAEQLVRVTVTSTLDCVASKPRPARRTDVPEEVIQQLATFERLFALLLANPMYLSNIFKVYLTDVHREPKLAKAAVVTSRENFVSMCKAVYGPLRTERSQRLCLVLLKLLLHHELFLFPDVDESAALRVGGTDSTFGMLVAHLFSATACVDAVKLLLGESVANLVSERTPLGAALDLEHDPVLVYNSLRDDPRDHIDPDSATLHTRDSLWEDAAVKTALNGRMTRLVQLAQTWFDKLAQSVQFLPYSLRWLCRQVARLLRQRFPTLSTPRLHRAVARFVFERIVRPILTQPLQFKLLVQGARVNAVQQRNIQLVCDVLKAVYSGSEPKSQHRWLQPVTSLVQQNEPAVLDFVRELISVTDDMRFLMTMDMFDEHTRLEPLVHVVQLNELLYARAVCARPLTRIKVKEDDPLVSTAKELFASQVHREQAMMYDMRPPAHNNGFNLTIETRLAGFPPEQPWLCPTTQVPLTHRLAPDDADQLVIEAVFEIDAGDEGTQALKRLLREDPVPVQSVEELKSRLAKQERMRSGAASALLYRVALARLQEVEARARDGMTAFLESIRADVRARSTMAGLLMFQQQRMEQFKSNIGQFQSAARERLGVYNSMQRILRDGLMFEQNREAVARAAKRLKVKLTPPDLVRAVHKKRETNPTKHELQGGREIMGTFRQFTYKELHALGAVLDVAFEGDMTVESKDSILPKLTYLFSGRESGQLQLRTVYAGDMVLENCKVSVRELFDHDRAFKTEIVFSPPHSRVRTSFHVNRLLRTVQRDLTLQRLLLT